MTTLEIDELCQQQITDDGISEIVLQEQIDNDPRLQWSVILYQLGYLKRMAELIGDDQQQIDIGYSNADEDIRAGRLREWDMSAEAVACLREMTMFPILNREEHQRATAR